VSTPLRIGIAGYGIVGRRRHACLIANPLTTVVAVCDQSPLAAAELSPEVAFLSSYVDLLDMGLDALFVCMSNDMTAEVSVAALNSGLHVFCEKPPARSLEELEQVIEAERASAGLKLMYGFNHRFHDSVGDALRIVESRELGGVVSLRGVYGKSQMITFDQGDWRTHRDIAGGGVLLDQGIHMVDLIRLFGGEFEEVHSCVSNDYWHFDVEDNAYALMRSSNGTVAMLHSSATQWRHRFALDVTLERGSVELAGLLTGSKSYGSETLTVVRSSPGSDRGEPREQRTLYNSDPSWQREVDEFARVVTEDRPVLSGSSADAKATLGLVSRIYYQDESWRRRYALTDPSPLLAATDPHPGLRGAPDG
jgi:predicted dehydrogenase